VGHGSITLRYSLFLEGVVMHLLS